MKLTTIIASLFIAGSSLVSDVLAGTPECYPLGATMENKHMRYHADRACGGYDGKQGAFQGVFKPGQKKTACVNVYGQHINMEVQNLNSQRSFDLNDNDCKKEFRRIIDHCDLAPFDIGRGGKNTQSGWYFRTDPNDGRDC